MFMTGTNRYRVEVCSLQTLHAVHKRRWNSGGAVQSRAHTALVLPRGQELGQVDQGPKEARERGQLVARARDAARSTRQQQRTAQSRTRQSSRMKHFPICASFFLS
jgi:hypothetical protein